MGMSLDRALRAEKSLTSELQNMLDNLERFCWTHRFYLEAKVKWMQGDLYRKAPRWLVERLAGFEQARMALIWRHKVEFSYEIDGKRYLLKSPSYHRVVDYKTLDVNTGAFVWKDSPDMFFTLPGEATKHSAQTCQV